MTTTLQMEIQASHMADYLLFDVIVLGRHEYMALLMLDQENIEKGMEKGMEEGMKKGKSVGEEMMLILIQKLVDDSRFDDIAKIKDNKDYRRKLYTEYNISI